jgi:predicted transcriptional regulator
MIAGFANQNELSKEDIDELKAVIKQWEKNND